MLQDAASGRGEVNKCFFEISETLTLVRIKSDQWGHFGG